MSRVRKLGAGFWLYVIAGLALLLTVYSLIAGQVHANDATRAQRDEAKQSRKTLACIQEWANATSARSRYLNHYLLPRNDAQAALGVAEDRHESDATVDRLRKRFITLSFRYDRAQKTHPLPPSPQFLCARRTVTVDPSSSAGATLNPPAQQPPGPTAPAPGPAATHPADRRTRHVAPSSSATHHPQTSSPDPRPRPTTPPPSRSPPPAPAPSTPPAASSSTPLVPGLLCPVVRSPLLCPSGTP